MNSRVTEYKLTLKNGSVVFPKLTVLKNAKNYEDSGLKVFLEVKYDVVPTLVGWLEEMIPNRFRINGVFSWEEDDFQVRREFHGVIIYFDEVVDAIMLKLRWCRSRLTK